MVVESHIIIIATLFILADLNLPVRYGIANVYTIKHHFYAREKFMRICRNGSLDKFIRFLLIRSSALCIVTYGVIENAVQIYATSA